MAVFSVNTGVDDGCVVNAGSAFYNDSDIWVGYGPNNGFFRLSNVTIPKGAIIDSAIIQIYVNAYDGAGEYKYRVYAVAEDNPATISSYADYFARSLTSAYVDWSPTFPDTDWYWSEDYDIPDIKTVIQEIVNRPGWVSGNSLILMAKNNASAKSSIWDFYEDTGYEINLAVTYHMEIDVPTINTNVEAKIPTILYDRIINVPTINTTVEAKTPTITYNKKINVPLIEISCEAKTPTVTYIKKVNVPLINVTVEAKTPTILYNRVIDVPLIEITVEAKKPTIKINYNFIVSAGNYFTKNRFEKFEFELLSLNNERYENAGWVTDYVIRDSASITMDFSRDIIGSANFNIRNNTDINYLSDLIRPWYVINDTYRFPLGTYMLSSPRKKSDAKLITRPIQGYDLLLALEQDKMINSYTIEAGTNVIEAIETLLYIVGANLWVNADITPSDEVLATDVSYELGKSKLFIINSLLNMINYYPLWADGNGVFRSIPWTNEPNKTYEFIDDNLSIYAPGIELVLDYTNMYNRVVILNNQLIENTAPLYKIWTFEDENLENHPLSYSSLGRYITKIFQSEAVSQDYVDLRARRELLKMLEIEESVNYNHMFISARENDGLPWQGDCYRFKNTKLDVDSIYKLESMTYNLKTGGLVNSRIKRIRSTY
jgi:hypothetical protein